MRPAEIPPDTTPRWNRAARSRAPFFLITALLLALLAGVLTYLYLDRLKQQALPTTQVIVAVHEHRPGDLIASDGVEARPVPGLIVPEGAMTSTSQVVGRRVLYPVALGEVVLERDLFAGDGVGLSARLPEGRWAMVFPVGWLVSPLPEVGSGEQIDILAYPPGKSADQAGLIVEGVELVGQKDSGEGLDQVTMAVSLEQAASILYAQVNGFRMLGLIRAR